MSGGGRESETTGGRERKYLDTKPVSICDKNRLYMPVGSCIVTLSARSLYQVNVTVLTHSLDYTCDVLT